MLIRVNEAWLSSDLVGDLGAIPKLFLELVDSGFREEAGCLLLEARAAKCNLRDLLSRLDKTGVEAFVNSFHLADLGFAGLDIQMCLKVARLTRQWGYSIPSGKTIRVIISGALEDPVFRVYLVREGEPWLDEDIDLYSEPMLVLDIEGGREQ